MKGYTIGRLAKIAGCSVESIRHYEHIGVLKVPPRTPSGHRRYTMSHVNALKLIMAFRQIGFSLKDIGRITAFLDCDESLCTEIESLTSKYKQILAEKRKDLDACESALRKMTEVCQDYDKAPSGSVTDRCHMVSDLISNFDGPCHKRTKTKYT